MTTDENGNNILTTTKGKRVNLGPGTLRVSDAKALARRLDGNADIVETVELKLQNAFTQLKSSLDEMNNRLEKIEEELKIGLTTNS